MTTTTPDPVRVLEEAGCQVWHLTERTLSDVDAARDLHLLEARLAGMQAIAQLHQPKENR
ncbi:hypothetical protein [Streptomyces clavuligerus]|uniref:hypothetical protein n=1 Tax=Streptomyces clavuligerus TaxID=1901 RepID=UPI00018008BE|nr:hypothetical protein [Streptomyces clavuligerus]EDY52990.1 hypothetical protein SSCG_06072 [Streptomyces clavuligerus]WDN55995.1 hypothetical protein LL058_29355 [Streptomyces clavuligerus]